MTETNLKTLDLIDILSKIPDYEKLDKIFYYHFPKEIVEIIYSYSKEVCDKCYTCCNLCQIYCYFQCLRENQRDICCQSEFDLLLKNLEYKKEQEMIEKKKL